MPNGYNLPLPISLTFVGSRFAFSPESLGDILKYTITKQWLLPHSKHDKAINDQDTTAL